ncbi:MAG: glycine--tRNA ligase subunit beta [Planctomycetes bacterium]|nr:glycine--tRNA ligase subunit beta [Planctomycetota bacterium]
MNYLLEIGCEEIPAFYLQPADETFRLAFQMKLDENKIKHGYINSNYSPRRLTIFISELSEKQEDSEEFVVGPPKDRAFAADGTPTKALEGFCKKNNISVEDVEDYEEVKKNKTVIRVAATMKIKGKKTSEILQKIVPQTLKKIKFPKYMRWGRKFKDGTIFEFARPVRYFLSLLDDKVLEFDSAGIPVGNKTQTHRFIDRDTDFIEIESADLEEYELELAKNGVVLDADERIQLIKDEISELCAQVGLKVDVDVKNSLLLEVANLVEFPRVFVGEFEKEYLEVPSEILKSAMIKHQRYFPLEDSSGNLQNKFLIVINRSKDDENVIKAGNERVLRARLHDARVFWQNDVRTGIEEYAKKLGEVSFHQDLGSMDAKVERLTKVAVKIANDLEINTEKTRNAARLCKADLVSETVYEFADLQGNIGGLLVFHAGFHQDICCAVYNHYKPASRDDEIPPSDLGKAISLADKLDSLAGYFLCELDKKKGGDPLGLRRLTLGVIRIAQTLPGFDVSEYFKHALEEYFIITRKKKDYKVSEDDRKDAVTRFEEFITDRLNVILRDEGKPYDVINAMIASGCDNLNLVDVKLEALIGMLDKDNWIGLVKLVERTANITKKTPELRTFEITFLLEDAEKVLAKAYNDSKEKIENFFENKQFAEGAELFFDVFEEKTENFFDNVFVNVEDEKLRNNRLGLIRSIYNLFGDNFARLEHIVISGNDEK